MPKDTTQASHMKHVQKHAANKRPFNRPDNRTAARGNRNLKAGRKR